MTFLIEKYKKYYLSKFFLPKECIIACNKYKCFPFAYIFILHATVAPNIIFVTQSIWLVFVQNVSLGPNYL